MRYRGLLLILGLASQALAQTIIPVSISPVSTAGFQEVSWPAYSGSTYYLQTSPDLINWTVNPSYVIGDNMLHGMVIGNATELFAQVISCQGLPTDDNDGDGLTNDEEITSDNRTDPDLADSDGDGATDGEEAAAGTDPNDPESSPAFVVIITVPSADSPLRILLDETLSFLADNSAAGHSFPGWVVEDDPPTPESWYVELSDRTTAQTASVEFHRLQDDAGSRKLTLLNVRKIDAVTAPEGEDILVDPLTLEIPSDVTEPQPSPATNDPLPKHGGYGKWNLLPVLVVELAPKLRDFTTGEDVDRSEVPDLTRGNTNPMVERNPVQDRIAHRDIKIKIGDGAVMEGAKVTWSMEPLFTPPGSEDPGFRGEWTDSQTHPNRFEASTEFEAYGFEEVSQEEGRTEIDAEGFTGIRVNVPPIGFNRARISIHIDGTDDPIELIDMEVPAVVVIDPGHGGTQSVRDFLK